jgi:putative holliday junction resolvase
VRILAIDPGTVRLGLALSDPSGVIAQPLSVLRRRSPKEDLVALKRVVDDHQVERIVIGLPKLMNGTLDVAARDAQAFGAEVERATGRPVAYWDERLTTVAAERHLIAQGTRRLKRRASVDQIAATLLLQGYLDYQAGRGPGGA